MTKIDVHEKKIKEVFWPDTDTEQGRHLKSNHETKLMGYVENFGDHGIFFVLQFYKNMEVARHTAKYIESIIWEQDWEEARHGTLE